MTLTKRGTVVAVAVFTALALFTAACSSNKDDKTSTGSTGTSSAGSDYDYASLSGTLNGSGATFPKAFYEDAISAFGDVASGVTVNYGGGGSGKGKTDLATNVVQWAGTDSLIKDADLPTFTGGTVLYFPTVAAPITVSYNLSGVKDLQLSPDTLAGIFQAKITTWDDAAIKTDNPNATLPSTPITVVHRSDGSGTTSNFTNYLKAAAPSWTLDAGDTVNWPTSTQAGNGNAGVAQIVKSTKGAIGYVDLSDAKASGLKYAQVKNQAGKFVEPTTDSASAAGDGIDVKDNLLFSALDPKGDAAYPITYQSWVIVYAKQTNPTKGAALKSYIKYLVTDGQAQLKPLDFAALPKSLADKAVAQLDKIQVQ